MTIPDCARWLRERDDFLILTHRRPDGDALGSSAALCRGLRALGKTACLLENPESTERYIPYVQGYYATADFLPRWVISTDLADEGILQVNAEAYRSRIQLSIDHHPSNSGYAAETLLMAERAACGEIIYLLLLELLGSIDVETANLLYIAVSTDTGCFRYKNTTPDTMRVGAALMEAGASRDLNRKLFMRKRRSRLELESRILNSLDFFQKEEACIGVVTLDDMARAGATEADMEDIAVVAGQVESVELSCTLRQTGERSWKVSVRTGDYANAGLVCAEFGGGGHGMAAGASLEGSLEEVKEALKAAVRKHWKQQP